MHGDERQHALKIKDQLLAVQQSATDWTKKNPGSVALASTIDDLLNQLALETPAGKAGIVILFHSERKREPYEESGMVDRTFWIVMTVGKGLKADASARLIGGAAGAPALYELAEDFRDRVIRSLSFSAETTEVTPDYKGMEPLEVNNQTLTDALKLEFWIGTQMPQVQAQ